ncbi:hypothetical protein F25303_11775 [Fusarium sp. NRRL 25303]|nr:hypothetical protein F25303_11775 [Fusarium sp. NRRL 25303]
MLKEHPITTFLLFNAACRQTLDSGHPQPEEFHKQRYIQLLDAISLWRLQSAIMDSYPSLDNREIIRLPLAPEDLRCSNVEAAIRKRWNQQSEDQVEARWHTSLRKKSFGLIGMKGIKDLYYIDLKRFCLHFMASTELKISYPTKAVHSAVKAAKDTDDRAPQRMNGGLIEAANTGQALPDMLVNASGPSLTASIQTLSISPTMSGKQDNTRGHTSGHEISAIISDPAEAVAIYNKAIEATGCTTIIAEFIPARDD